MCSRCVSENYLWSAVGRMFFTRGGRRGTRDCRWIRDAPFHSEHHTQVHSSMGGGRATQYTGPAIHRHGNWTRGIDLWVGSRLARIAGRSWAGFEKGRTGRHRSGWPRLQRALVIAEFAIALTLLVGVALAVTSFSNLLRAARSDLRAPLERVLTFDLSRPESRPTDPASTRTFVHAVLERLRSTPGVLADSAQTNTPLYRSRESASFTFVGTRAQDDLSLQPQVDVGAVTPEYFKTFGVSLVKAARSTRGTTHLA